MGISQPILWLLQSIFKTFIIKSNSNSFEPKENEAKLFFCLIGCIFEQKRNEIIF